MNHKNVYLGLIGLGTVGSGVVKLLQENGDEIRSKTSFNLILKKIIVKDLDKKRDVHVDSSLLSSNADDVLNDPQIDIVIGAIGGYEPERTFVLKALENGKYVVTPNKALLSKYGEELAKKAEESGTDIYFESSVGGGIPVLLPLGLSLCANKIKSITGILNGTCNYILTKMGDGMTYRQALTEAQEKGFAEADPTLDVDGTDSVHKLVILASLAFGTVFKVEDVQAEGIIGVTKQDLEYAMEMGYRIKLLAVAKETEDGIELRVNPAMIKKKRPLASVKDELNAISVTGNFSGEVTFLGQGAGGKPTASAVMGDVINCAQDKFSGEYKGVHLLEMRNKRKKSMKNPENVTKSYYMRLSAVDKPGVMKEITRILADKGISIASIIQKEMNKGNVVPIVMMTHLTKEGSIRSAVEEIDRLSMIKANTKIIGVER